MSVFLVALGLWAVSETKSKVALSGHMLICLGAGVVQIVYFIVASSFDVTAFVQSTWQTSGLADFSALQVSQQLAPKWPDAASLEAHVSSNIRTTTWFGVFSTVMSAVPFLHSVRFLPCYRNDAYTHSYLRFSLKTIVYPVRNKAR